MPLTALPRVARCSDVKFKNPLANLDDLDDNTPVVTDQDDDVRFSNPISDPDGGDATFDAEKGNTFIATSSNFEAESASSNTTQPTCVVPTQLRFAR